MQCAHKYLVPPVYLTTTFIVQTPPQISVPSTTIFSQGHIDSPSISRYPSLEGGGPSTYAAHDASLPVASYPSPALPATRGQLPIASYPRLATQGKARQGGLYLEIKESIMPPKKSPKKNASGSKTSCDLCTKLIAEDKEQAIQCEGTCQQWYHRYCAGVSTKLFKHLSSNDSPFICMSCRQQFQDAQVSQLQSEVANLRSELLELRKLVHSITNLPAIATLLQGEPGEVNFITERVSQPLTMQ